MQVVRVCIVVRLLRRVVTVESVVELTSSAATRRKRFCLSRAGRDNPPKLSQSLDRRQLRYLQFLLSFPFYGAQQVVLAELFT